VQAFDPTLLKHKELAYQGPVEQVIFLFNKMSCGRAGLEQMPA
jgi:hypothetical protein